MAPLLHYQPFKALYLTYFALTFLIFKLPAWSIYYIPRRNRPRATWTIKRSVIIRGLHSLSGFTVKLNIKGKRDLTKEVPDSKLKDAKFAWVEGVGDDIFCGRIRALAEKTNVQSVRIPGYWLLKKNQKWGGEWKAEDHEKTVLHLHGGAFYIGSANPSFMTSNITRGLLQHSEVLKRTFAVDYRLCASSPDPAANPFPAALIDSIAAYRYLIQDMGFEPENVIVAGDSAGGNLAVGLVRHLIDNSIPELPPPGHLLTMSAWLDLSGDRKGPETSGERNALTDIFAPSKPANEIGTYGVASLLGPLDRDEVRTNPYFSPTSPHIGSETLFKGYPGAYVVAGGSERLFDDSVILAKKMAADGVEVITDFPPDAVHDFCVYFWHEPERTEVLRRISHWIDNL